MKTVTVNSWWLENVDFILIENIEDLKSYAAMENSDVEDAMVRMMRSDEGIERWDHLVTNDSAGGIMAAAINKVKVAGGAIIPEASALLNKKIHNMLLQLMDGETLLVNKVGGWQPVTDKMTLTNIRPFTPTIDLTYVIAKNASIINLENDPKLEQHVIDYFDENESELSYVLNLRRFGKDDLITVFMEFIEAGGHTVYVYTTGLDVQQMFEYSDAIIESGLKNVVFEFTAGISDSHKEVIQYLKDAEVIVEVK